MGCGDGVNAWKELGKSSFLLVVFAVWNLPADIRMKPENLILLGMTDKKPADAHLIYEVVVDQLLELWAGVACWDSVRDKQFKLRAMMATGLFDYPGLCETCGQPNEGVHHRVREVHTTRCIYQGAESHQVYETLARHEERT